jgi:hypothetical protein
MGIETFPQTTLGAAAAAVVEGLVPKREPFAPGIYFGLDAADYHADQALGSTDIRRLAQSPQDFWFESRFNPMRDDDDDDDTEAKAIGDAMHLMVLEGRDVLDRRYAPAWHPGNVKAGKDERALIVAKGKEPIKGKHWKRILTAGTIVRNNRYLRQAFETPIGNEVSVFWTDRETGMPKKARFDSLRPRAIVDLKSIANRDQIDFVTLCRKHIAVYRYYVQAAHYMDGWREMAALVQAGSVFGLPQSVDSERTLVRLTRAANQEAAAFVFIFVQKTGAPMAWGTQISPGNGLLDHGRAVIEQAMSNWKTFTERHGVTEPWVFEEPLEELDVNDLPAWAFRS